MDKDHLILSAMALVQGNGSGNDVGSVEYDFDVARAVAAIRRQFSDRSIASRVCESVPIPAKVTSVDFEDSSNRYLVTYVPVNAAKGHEEPEYVRTDRVDGRKGACIREMVDGIVGKHCVIYKYTEPTGNARKPSVRIAPLILVV